MMSAGVCMRIRISRQKTLTITVMITANTAESQMLLPTYRRRPFSSSAPNRWATGMAKPVHTPMQKPLIRKLTEPVEPTAARDWLPLYCPTTMISTALNISCSTPEIISGTANTISLSIRVPLHMSISYLFFFTFILPLLFCLF